MSLYNRKNNIMYVYKFIIIKSTIIINVFLDFHFPFFM